MRRASTCSRATGGSPRCYFESGGATCIPRRHFEPFRGMLVRAFEEQQPVLKTSLCSLGDSAKPGPERAVKPLTQGTRHPGRGSGHDLIWTPGPSSQRETGFRCASGVTADAPPPAFTVGSGHLAPGDYKTSPGFEKSPHHTRSGVPKENQNTPLGKVLVRGRLRQQKRKNRSISRYI